MGEAKRGPRGPLEAAFSQQMNYAIRAARTSKTDLATDVGITVGAVSAYCGGQYLPKPNVLRLLEDRLDVRFVMNDPAALVPLPAPQREPVIEPPRSRGLTIAEAKRALGESLGVAEDAIEIHIRA